MTNTYPMRVGNGRTKEAEHWIAVDEASMKAVDPADQGWRLHVEMDLADDQAWVDLTEEQVFPERVERVDANHVRNSNGIVRLHLDDMRWLRDRLDELIPEVERRVAIYAARAKGSK